MNSDINAAFVPGIPDLIAKQVLKIRELEDRITIYEDIIASEFSGERQVEIAELISERLRHR